MKFVTIIIIRRAKGEGQGRVRSNSLRSINSYRTITKYQTLASELSHTSSHVKLTPTL